MNVSSAAIDDVINVTQEFVVNISHKQNQTELVIYIAFEVCIALFAFVNNVLVIIALWKFQTLRTPTNWFVASLAVADIAVAIFAIPSAILLRLGLSLKNDCGAVTQPSVSEGTCLFIVSSVIFLTQVSVFSLLIIAIDRFIAISYPLRYGVFMTSFKTRVGIIAAWAFGALIGVAPELGWNKWAGTEDSNCERQRCAFEDVISMEYMVYFNFFGCILLPLLIMGAIYTYIFRSAKNQLRKIYFDVKSYKKKVRDSRAPGVADNTRSTTSSMNFDIINGSHSNNKKKKKSIFRFSRTQPGGDKIGKFSSEITSETFVDESSFIEPETFGAKYSDLAGNRDSKLHQLEKISEKAVNCDLSTHFTPHPKEISTSNPAIHAEETEIAGKCNLNSKSAGNDENLPQSNHDKNGIAKVISSDIEYGAERRKKLAEMRKRLHERSVSCEGENGNLDYYTSQDEISHERRNHRLRCKAHSFSASTNTKHLCNQSKASYNLKATPLQKLANGELPSSLNSSRSTIYTSEHGVWTTSESGNAHRRMKRKRQLLKKEFKAARSLATVVGLFAICWLPLHILNSITLFCPGCFQPNWLKDLAILLSHANSLVNPLLYAYKLRDFRNAFRRILSPVFTSKFSSERAIPTTTVQTPGGLCKMCCIIASNSDVIDDFPSDDRTLTFDSPWKSGNSHKVHVVRLKTSDNRNTNNNNSNDKSTGNSPKNSPVFSFFRKSTKRGFCKNETTRNSTDVTLLPPESFEDSQSSSRSQNDSLCDSISSSSDHIFIKNMSLDDDIETCLLNSPETTV
uniref:muscarinic acetylcholine receptor M3-like n=1 Tax=Styela clava TaxID=7725 RepID=UPI00193A1B8F|nr:muscarinic acetylcholine receptor M3-like [Styela clava]